MESILSVFGSQDIKNESPINIQTVTTDQRHYRGDPRIYAIQCFTQKYYNRVVKYIQERDTRNKEIPDNMSLRLYVTILRMYQNKIYNPDKKPYSNFVTLVQILNTLDETKQENVSVLEIVRKSLEGVTEMKYEGVLPKERFTALKKEYDDLVQYLTRVEDMKSEKELADSNVMDAIYFSVQRQNIAYFGTYSVSITYAKQNKRYMYVYQNKDNLRMVNLSDKKTLYWLMKSGPFNSDVKYTNEKLAFYNDGVVPGMFFDGLFNYVMNVKRLEPELKELKQDIDAFLSTKPTTMQGADQYINRYLQMYEQHVYNMMDHLHDAFVFKSSKLRKQFQYVLFKNISYSAGLRNLSKPSSLEYLTEQVFFSSDYNGRNKAMYPEKDRFPEACNWTDFFQYDLPTPRGLFAALFWSYLYDNDSARNSEYVMDSLLSDRMLETKFFDAYQLQGWICYAPYEIMVIDPAAHGHLERLQAEVPIDENDPQCMYARVT